MKILKVREKSLTVGKREIMDKNGVWKWVAAAFVLNSVGLLWIKNEVVKAGRESSGEDEKVYGLLPSHRTSGLKKRTVC